MAESNAQVKASNAESSRLTASTSAPGDVLWEYQGPRAHPILYAGAILFFAVFLMGSLENLLRDQKREIFVIYAMPVVGVLAIMALLWTGPVRIHVNGIAPPRPAILAWRRPFIAWNDCAAIYPVSYDVTGAFVSPFASSDGKVTQTGVGMELRDGAIEVVRFTPSRFAEGRQRSRGYKEAWPLVQELWAKQGRPMVAQAPTFDPPQRAAMIAKARAPFLPFWAIVVLFCSAAPITLVLAGPVGLPVAAAVAIGLVAPLGTSLRSYQKSRERNRILNALSKAAMMEGP